MTRSLNRIGTLLILACSLSMAGIASAKSYGEQPQERREAREEQRLMAYSADVLRNNRRECGVMQEVMQHPNGKIVESGKFQVNK